MEFIIRYGKEFEITRIKSCIPKKDWYKKHNLKFFLPKGVFIDNIKEKVEQEFDIESYKRAERDLFNFIKEIPQDFFNKLEKKTGKKIPKKVKIILTRYGVFGSYNLPNLIIININRKHNLMIKTLKHELVHLLVEEEVQKKKLTHKQKEELVESILSDIE